MQNLKFKESYQWLFWNSDAPKCTTLRSYSFSIPKLTNLPKLAHHAQIKNLRTISPLTNSEIYGKGKFAMFCTNSFNNSNVKKLRGGL